MDAKDNAQTGVGRGNADPQEVKEIMDGVLPELLKQIAAGRIRKHHLSRLLDAPNYVGKQPRAGDDSYELKLLLQKMGQFREKDIERIRQTAQISGWKTIPRECQVVATAIYLQEYTGVYGTEGKRGPQGDVFYFEEPGPEFCGARIVRYQKDEDRNLLSLRCGDGLPKSAADRLRMMMGRSHQVGNGVYLTADGFVKPFDPDGSKRFY